MQKADSNLLNPRNATEVQTLFKKAFKENIPVYVYRQATEGGAAVSLLGLDKIIEIDAANLVATVEPGVELGSLNSALRERGLRFVPADNVFYQKKILGEFIYEGCSNLLSTKYGITKHFLMGSAIVLPNGEMLNTGGKTVKNVTGYDFTRFFNGSYANLGVAVKYLLKLLPLPETRKNITVKVKDTAAAISIIKEMRQMKIVPSYLVWSNEETLQMIGCEAIKGQILVFELDGVMEEVNVQYSRVNSLLKMHQAEIIEEGAQIGEVAVKLGEAYQPKQHFALTDELKFPFKLQQAFIDKYRQEACKQKINAGLFGQLADGKLNILLSKFDKEEHSFIQGILAAAQLAGGFSSGKYERIYQKTYSGALTQMEQKLKAVFDPQFILNR